MARLPVPGGDEDVWGEVLNEFLVVSHNDDGTLKGVDNINGVTINGTPDTDSVIIADSGSSATWQPAPFISSNNLSNYGDLLTYSDAPTTLGLGDSGTVLTVDYNSGVGMSWMSLPPAINGITSTGPITIDNSNPSNPVIGFNAGSLPNSIPTNGLPGQTLVKQIDGTIAWKNDAPRLTPKIIQINSGRGRDLNGPTSISVNLNNSPTIGNTVLMAMYIRSSGPTMSGWSNVANGWNIIQDTKVINDSLIVGIKTVDSTSSIFDLGQFVSTDNNSAYSWALYEFSGLSSSDPIIFIDGISGFDQTQSHFKTSPYSPKGGLGLVILGNRSVSGGPFAAGQNALPYPISLDINNNGDTYCGIGAYTVDLNNSTEFIGHITGIPGNAGNDTFAGLAILLQGDLLSSAFVSNPNSNSNSRDSRISLATGDTNAVLDTLGTWVNIGTDTAPWRYMTENQSVDLAGSDFALANDGSGVNVLNDCTIMVRLAFQMSRMNNGTNIAYAAPRYATNHGSGFPGLITGDGDPISQAVNGSNQDLIFNYLWRVSAGSKLEFSVRIAGNTANEHTDGFCLDVVRIS